MATRLCAGRLLFCPPAGCCRARASTGGGRCIERIALHASRAGSRPRDTELSTGAHRPTEGPEKACRAAVAAARRSAFGGMAAAPKERLRQQGRGLPAGSRRRRSSGGAGIRQSPSMRKPRSTRTPCRRPPSAALPRRGYGCRTTSEKPVPGRRALTRANRPGRTPTMMNRSGGYPLMGYGLFPLIFQASAYAAAVE